MDEVPLTITYSDCQVPVDEKIEDENLVMQYAKQISSTSKNSSFLQAIAKIAGKPKGILFPENNLSKKKKTPTQQLSMRSVVYASKTMRNIATTKQKSLTFTSRTQRPSGTV